MIKKEIGSFIKWYACVKYDLNSNLFIDWPFGKIKNKMMKESKMRSNDNVKVIVRVRPPLQREL